MTDKYILEGHKPRPATLMEWATWYETADRIVKQETVGDARAVTSIYHEPSAGRLGP